MRDDRVLPIDRAAEIRDDAVRREGLVTRSQTRRPALDEAGAHLGDLAREVAARERAASQLAGELEEHETDVADERDRDRVVLVHVALVVRDLDEWGAARHRMRERRDAEARADADDEVGALEEAR